ncbi:MAG TPA: trehalose-phosphatase [Dehalococcoidia bacterium]|jgi:trehalose 6-phosphate phosphatase|nr:trehalose-phosphatase [Dehalococcoidia bacterium]
MAAVGLSDFEAIRPLLTYRPLGLFSDIDGTLAPIVPRPDEAEVTPRCRRLLQSLIDHGSKVALVTGRTLKTARAMAGLDSAAYAASHGLEVWVDGRYENTHDLEEYPRHVDQIMREARGLDDEGVNVEVKGAGVAFHYRGAPDEEKARSAIMGVVEASATAQRFSLTEGRKVIELRPRTTVNKGTAVRHLAQRLDVKALVCLGDDLTDVDMFEAARGLAASGLPSANIAVRSNETAEELVAAADYIVDGVGGVEWFLAELVRAVGGTSP